MLLYGIQNYEKFRLLLNLLRNEMDCFKHLPWSMGIYNPTTYPLFKNFTFVCITNDI